MDAALQDLTINIPSRGRAGRVLTLASLPIQLLGITRLIVPREEAEAYRREYGRMVGEVVARPPGNIPVVRQFITDTNPTKFMMQMADDTKFSYRDGGTKLHPAGPNRVQEMVERLCDMLATEGYMHCGLSARAGNNRIAEPVKLLGRMWDTYAHNVEYLREHNIRWDQVPLMEDYDVCLQLLRRGHANPILYSYAGDQPGSNSGGGCSTYRTFALQREAALALAERHWPYVKAVEKPSKNWKGFDTRWDVVVYWQKALKAADLRADSEVVA